MCIHTELSSCNLSRVWSQSAHVQCANCADKNNLHDKAHVFAHTKETDLLATGYFECHLGRLVASYMGSMCLLFGEQVYGPITVLSTTSIFSPRSKKKACAHNKVIKTIFLKTGVTWLETQTPKMTCKINRL